MMKEARKILILYAKFGDGHYQVAQALKQQFEEQGAAEAALYDPFAEAYPALNRWSQSVYYLSTSQYPKAYGWGYELTDRIRSTSAIGRWLHSLGADRLIRTLNEERPDAVIQTFPLLTMSHVREQTGCRIPTYTVLTDYVLHSRWLHRETDRYFVATEELKADLAGAGFAPERISVSGIPIRSRFRAPAPAEAEGNGDGAGRTAKFVLLMAGAYGVSAEVGKMASALLESEDYSVLLVCGKNGALEDRMRRLFAGEPRVRVFGFVERIERLMAKSFCMISKAGGITLTEAVSLGLPVITYRPIPGQESGNAKYWASKGMLTIANDLEQLKRQTNEWLAQTRTSESRQSHVSLYSAADAASAIATQVLSDLGAGSAAVHRPLIPLNKKRRWLQAILGTH